MTVREGRAGIALRGVTKRFGGVAAVDALDLDIEAGSFVTLLGPSGCGKTTVLRMIAGLAEPDAGEIRIGDRAVASVARGTFVPPAHRGIGLVFQSYALWPHMTVFENVAFGLEVQRLPRAEIRRRVEEAAAGLQIETLLERYPSELSGGQQQRVALARMLAARPAVFLLDEPLSNLDARLRIDMRAELKRLHHDAGATTVYVTHDQAEALALSDRVAVLERGVLIQYATPDELYARPASLFVAEFMGDPKTNVLPATVRNGDGGPRVVAGDLTFAWRGAPSDGLEVVVALRPEDLEIEAAPAAGAPEFSVYELAPAGAGQVVTLRRGELLLTVREARRSPVRLDQRVWVRIPPERVAVYDRGTGRLLA